MTELIEKNRRFFRRVNFLANLLKPDSLDLDNILILSIVLARSSAAFPMMRLLNKNTDMKTMLKNRWRPSPVDLEKLQNLPSWSLGHLYARHMIDNKIDAMKYDDPITSDADYIVHRLRETHDILHTLLGCGIDQEGELQTQAFCIFNLRSPLNVILAVVLLFRLFYSDTPLEQAVISFTKGARQGVKAKNLLASKFEAGWDRSIDEWRKELCIEI